MSLIWADPPPRDPRPAYRPPLWLWMLVIAGVALVTRALVFGWKGTHP